MGRALWRLFTAVLAGLAGLAFGLWAGMGIARAATPEVLALLAEGGNVLLVRHAATEPGVGDPPDFRLGDCATQRNLSAQGRDDARRLGEALRTAGVPVAEVRSSRWCRCLDTARLAFGTDLVKPWAPLDSFFGRPVQGAEKTRAALAGLAELPPDANWVWVTHQVNISALTGEHPASGEVVIVRPQDGTVKVVGRWRP